MKTVAIVLAAGKGTRMKSDIPKQYIMLEGYPVLYYALKVFEESFIDEVVLVTGENDINYCEEEVVKKYGFHKVKKVIAQNNIKIYTLICLNSHQQKLRNS